MATLRNDTVVKNADGQHSSAIITAANIGSHSIAPNSTYYVGTTQNVFNRASGAQTLTGVSIDGNAANITAYTINQNVGTANAPSFAGVISSAVTGYAYLQVVDVNNFWITPGNVNWGLYFETAAGGLLGGTGDSNRLGFVGSGAARFYVDLNNGNGWFGGSLTANTDSRAPIFYDSNNTAYYCDPASTSVINRIDLPSGSAVINTTTPGTSAYQLNFTGQSTADYAQAITWGWSTSGAEAGIYVQSSGAYGTKMYIATTDSFVTGSKTAITIDHTGVVTTNRNYLQATGSLRAPIFYDSDNTAYYIDAASTSNLVGLTVANTITGSVSGSSASCTGNAATATILQTARNINGTSFNGSAAITTASWGTARTLTIGSTGKSVDGSAAVSWSLAELGAAATNQTMFIGTTSVAINRASASQTLTGVSIDGNAATATNGLTTSNYVSYSAFTGSVSSGGNITATSYIYTSTYLQTGGNLIYPSGYGATQRLEVSNSANNSWIDGLTIAPGGIVTAPYEMRSPIFYDSNDTTYYIDPASTSRVVALWVRGSSETIGNIYVGGTSAGNRLNINYDQIWTSTGHLYLQYSGAGNIDMNTGGGHAFSRTSLRAPIFYDFDNTAYYVDPASTSVLNKLTIDGGNYANNYFQSLSDFVNGTLVTTDIPATAANGLSFVMNVIGKSYNTATSPFDFNVQGYLYNSTIINYSGMSLDSTGLSTIKVFENGGFLCFWWARVSYWNAFEVSVRSYDAAKTNYNRVTNITDVVEPTGTKKVTVTLHRFMRADASATNSVDLRAPIFYDSNDTAYYTDPSSLSNILELKTNKNWYDSSASAWGGGINMGGNSPSIGFQSTSSTWWYMLHHSSSAINFYRRSTSGSWNHDGIWDSSGNFIWQGSSVRASIFYDNNDTAYYINPNSTSNLYDLTVANNLTVNGNTYLGNAGGDTVFVNDIIRIGATDSGDASLFFGEGSVAGSDYGARWYWDSGYTFTWYTRNAGTDTSLFDYVTNDTTYLNWRRNFHMQNKEINYNAQIHFNAGTRFVGSSTNYLIFRSDATNAGGFTVQDGNATIKGYFGYWDAGGGGILNNTGNWAVRYNFGSSSSGGTLYGSWISDTDFRAPIFYDSNNTAYYVDAASTSILDATRHNSIVAGSTSGMSNGGAIAVYSGGSPYISFHDGTTARTAYFQEAGGRFYFGEVTYTESEGSFRAPLFYDSNNTAYYLDPASTSNLNIVTVNDVLTYGVIAAKSFSVSVNTSTYWTIVRPNGSSIATGYVYRITLCTTGTGTDTGEQYLLANVDSAGWVIKTVTKTGSGSNWPYVFLDSGVPKVKTDHASLYTVTVLIEELNSGNTGGLPSVFGLAGLFTSDNGTPKYRAGLFSSDNTLLHSGNYSGYSAFTSSLTSTVDARAPIFYDSNDTAYYGDFNNTGVSVNAAGAVRGTYYVASNYASTGYTQYKGYDNNNHFIVVRGYVGGTTTTPSITGGHATTFVEYAEANDSTGWFFRTAGTGNYDIVSRITRSYSSFEGSARAPIFYDSNDTGYYCDPNSTSRLNTLSVGTGAILINGAATATDRNLKIKGATSTGVGIVLYDGSDNFRCQIYGEASNYGFLDSLWGGWDIKKTIGGNLFLNNNTTYYLNPPSTTNLNNLTVAGDIRSPIFYDSNDTSYYLDINSSGSLIRGRVNITGGHYVSSLRVFLSAAENGAISGITTLQQWCSEPGNTWDGAGFGYNVDNALNEAGNVPAYYFGRPNTSFGQAYMRMTTDGNWYFYNTPNGSNTRYTTMVLDRTGYVTASNSIRSPIFHDSDNTAYYLDPASTSNLAGLTVANTITGSITGNAGGSSASCTGNSATTTLATKATRANGNFYIDDNYGNTVVGVYSASRYQGVFAMGDSYKLVADGSTTGNLYGIAWSHQNAGGAAANLASHGLLILENGVFKGAWGGGSFRTPSDVRGTLFYDWDNTGYYVDPASTSNLAGLTVANTISGSITGSAGSVAWTNVSGRPTAVSSFSNDSGYITSGGSISGSSGSCSGNAASVTDGVYLSTNQSISGVKTFSSAPVATNIAKAWVYYNMNNNTINASYNVSSVTDNGTGVCTVNFSSSMVDANYVVAGTATYGYDDQDIYAMILAVPRRSTAQQAGSCRLATEFIHAAQVYDCVAVRAVFYR